MVDDSVGGNPKWRKAWLGWASYFLGWSIWLASLPLKADYPLLGLGGNGVPSSVPATAQAGPVVGEVFGVECIPTEYLKLALVLGIVYNISMLLCASWPLIRRAPRWLCFAGRVWAAGALIAWAEVAYASQYINFRVLPGYPVLAVGSTLICLGVWLIPLRQKRKDIVASGPAFPPQAGPAPAIGGE